MTDSPAEDGTAAVRPVPFISRVRLKNYKSIAECDVRLGPLTILVGPNGSGKSNFLDALAFLSRAVATTPAEAIDERGDLHEILRELLTRARAQGLPYKETVDQAALAAAFDMKMARENSPSFDKFYRDVTWLLGASGC
jgi:predicted ATPase